MIGQRAELVASRQPGADEKAAYERVLTDALEGDATLFARMDYVEEAWRIVDPVLAMNTPVREYEPGTWGPADRCEPGRTSRRLGKPDGRRGSGGSWLTPTARPDGQPAELKRLEDSREWDAPWRKWGPYLSERQWGTVREDYSRDGDAWEYFPHDHARSRAYHWGEDGLAGFSDLKQRLCFALALWNGKDPILKERLFGLSNGEGNHGEDVKEYYFYLDSTPTHSYMKWLYKYPQAAFPYDDLVKTNARRTRQEFEYELIDTGVFDEDRYFDVFVEYAKSSPEECFIRITVANRGPETATIHLLPTLWFRNTWSWWPGAEKPRLAAAKGTNGASVVAASHPELGDRWLYCDGAPPLLFTENDTNTERLFGTPNASPYVKDAFHAFVVHGNTDAVNPAEAGTKAAAHYRLEVGAGQSVAVRLCLTDAPQAARPFAAFEKTLEARRREADEFYRSCTPDVRQRGHRARHATGLRRPLLDEAVLLLRRQHVAPRARRESVRRRRRRSRSGTASGSTCSTTTSSRCRTSGSTRGTPPGISPFTRSR